MPYHTILSMIRLLAIHTTLVYLLWALTLIPPPCGLRPRGRNQVRAFRSPFLTRRWYALCVGSCKCINRERMAPAVLLNLVDSWGTGFDRSDHSLISSSSLHFPGILDIDICCCSYIYDCIHSPWFRPLRPTAGGRNQVRVFRLRLIWVWVHTDMWRTSDHVVWLSEVRSEKSGETYHLPWPCIII